MIRSVYEQLLKLVIRIRANLALTIVAFAGATLFALTIEIALLQLMANSLAVFDKLGVIGWGARTGPNCEKPGWQHYFSPSAQP